MNRLMVALSAASMTLPSMALSNPFASERAVVKTNDLDLQTSEGRERLKLRVARAAVEVCGQQVSHIHPAVVAKARECRTAVIRDLASQRYADGGAGRVGG